MAEERADKTAIDRVATWLTGQSFNNVLLLLILVAIGWGGKYAGTVAIPTHLKQIQDGYETIDSRHREERSELRQQYDALLQQKMASKSGP